MEISDRDTGLSLSLKCISAGLQLLSRLLEDAGRTPTGIPLVEGVCERLKAPNSYSDLAVVTCREHVNIHRADEARYGTLVDLVTRCDALRRPERFEQILLACHADLRGRTGFEDIPYPQGERLRGALAAIRSVDNAALAMEGGDMATLIREARIKAVTEAERG